MIMLQHHETKKNKKYIASGINQMSMPQ